MRGVQQATNANPSSWSSVYHVSEKIAHFESFGSGEFLFQHLVSYKDHNFVMNLKMELMLNWCGMRNLLFKHSLLKTREMAKEYQPILSVTLLTVFLTCLKICLALSLVTVSYRWCDVQAREGNVAK